MNRLAALTGLVVLLSACGAPTALKPAASPSPSPSATACSPSPSPSPLPSPSPSPTPPQRVIEIVLSTQHLTAYEDGKAVLSTDVTTGRPGMETVTGHFHILQKFSPYVFISPWPRGDPNYYDPLRVNWAMLFADGGYFIHDAWWQRNWGPGADKLTGSHGCVNVPEAPMGPLYGWAQVGDDVIVTN